MEKEFWTVQESISRKVQLTHFDPNKLAVIETDASRKDLCCDVMQEGKPVKLLSKPLTPAEADCSNVERELLAILFACERLHTHIFGRTITIHTDYQALEMIFMKRIGLAPPRLQRMLLRPGIYDISVRHVGAKSVLLADTLSRLIRPGTDRTIPNLDVSIAQVMKIKPTYLETIQGETQSDALLRQLRETIMNGLPESMKDLTDPLNPY